MTSLIFLLEFIIFSCLILSVAFLLIIRPSLAIEIQRRFYEKINWKIEPISMAKEIRNTRIMGWFLIFIVLFAFGYILIRKI
jgi:hypothetical protein